MKKLILIPLLLLISFILVSAGPNDPTEFGNLTTTTAWIGGSAGIGNFTGWVETDDEFKGNIEASYIQNPIWIETADEGDLNVNSSTFWGVLSSYVTEWFYGVGTVFTFNETHLNATIDARSANATYTAGTGLNLTGTEFELNRTYTDSRY